MNESDVKELFAAAVARPDVDRIDTDAVLRGGRRRRRLRTAAALGSVAVVLVVVASLVVGLRPRGSDTPVVPNPVDTSGLAAAHWQFPEGMRPDATSTSLTVDVRWQACASGASVVDPRPVVDYSATEVSLTVWGIPPEGTFFDCVGTPATRMVIPLREPLGDRFVVPGVPPVTGFDQPVGRDIQNGGGLPVYAGTQRGTQVVSGVVTQRRNSCWYLSVPGDARYILVWPYGTRGVEGGAVQLPWGGAVRSGDRVSGTGTLFRDVERSDDRFGIGLPCAEGSRQTYVVMDPDMGSALG